MIRENSFTPLTKGQLSLWYLDQIDEQKTHYHISAALYIKPKIDVTILEQTFNILLLRHEALRSQIKSKNGQVFQYVNTSAKIKIISHDVFHKDNQQIKRELKLKSSRIFDLKNEIPLRIEVYQKEESSILYFCMHHIFADFWSISLLIEEFTQLYNAIILGQSIELKPVNLSYSQYAKKLSNWLNSSDVVNANAYWSNQLKLPINELSLGINKTRSLESNTTLFNHSQSRNGRHFKFKLSEEQTEQIFLQAKKFKCTTFSVLLAYYFKLLNKISGEQDISVGVPFLGRSQASEKLTFGYLVNPLPIICRNINKKSINQLSKQISDDIFDIKSKQKYPLSEVVKQYSRQRTLNTTPIFQTMFSFQKSQKSHGDWLAALTVEDESISFSKGGLSLRAFAIEPEIAQFEFAMVAALVNKQLSFDIQYDLNMFNEADVSLIVEDFKSLLLEKGECAELKSNNVYQNVGALIMKQIHGRPNKTAFLQHKRAMTYWEFGQSCFKWMSLLEKNNFKEGDHVVVILDQGFEQISATIAILLMGGFVAQLDTKTPNNRIQQCIKICQPKIIICNDKIDFKTNNNCINLSEFLCLKGNTYNSLKFNLTGLDKDQGGVLVFTSGSTGKPKCVVLGQKNLAYFTFSAMSVYQLTSDDVMLQFTSPGFDTFYEEVLPTLSIGAVLVPKTVDLTTDNKQFESFILEHKISIMSLPTAFWHAWMKQVTLYSELSLPQLRCVIVGGEVMSTELHNVWNNYIPGSVTLINSYGPSELTVAAFWHTVEKKHHTSIPIGLPFSGTEILIMDEFKQPITDQENGELYIHSPGLSNGYFNDQKLTDTHFVTLNGCSKKWFGTGDIVYRDSDGLLYFKHRKDLQIKHHGIRIEPSEIENLLCSVIGVSRAVVILYDGKLIAFIETNKKHNTLKYTSKLKQHLMAAMIPTKFYQIETLPITDGGKVDRIKLQEYLSTKEVDLPIKYPVVSNGKKKTLDEIEKVLMSFLLQWLGDNINKKGSLFEQGLDSLSAVSICSGLSDYFSVRVPVKVIFNFPYVDRLADNIYELLNIEAQSYPTKKERGKCSKQKIALSNSQKRVCFLNTFIPDKPLQYLQCAFKLEGVLDTSKFIKSWEQEINSRDSLRFTFSQSEPQYQAIDFNNTHRLNFVENIQHELVSDIMDNLDLHEKLKEEQQVVLFEAIFDNQKNKYFDSALVRFDLTCHVLLINVHPLVCDVESLIILLQSFQQRYNNHLQANQAKPGSYFDYVKSQSYLTKTEFYWQGILKGCSGAPQLAIKQEQQKPMFKMSETKLTVDLKLASKFKKFAAANQVTLASLFLAAYNIVLFKKNTDNRSFVIGTALSDRGLSGNHNTVGPFTNFGLIRSNLLNENTFFEVVQQSQNSFIDALENQYITLELLLSFLPKKGLYIPVENAFLYQSDSEESFSLSGIEASLITYKTSTLPALLCLEVLASKNTFELVLKFDEGVYDEVSISSMLLSILTSLEQGIVNKQVNLTELNLIPKNLQHCHKGEVIGWHKEEELIHSAFTNVAKKHPLKTAIIHNSIKISYASLYQLSTQVSQVIFSFKVDKKPLYVGVFMTKGWQQIASALGILQGGGTYAPINPDISELELIKLLDNSRISIIITNEIYKKLYTWPKHLKILTLDDPIIKLASDIPLSKQKVAINKMDPAYIMFTSGSTGTPKGVVISHQAALNTINAINQKIKLSISDCIIGVSNFNFDLSVYDIFGALGKGAKLILPNPNQLLDPSYILSLIKHHQVTIWNSVPAIYHALLDNMDEVYSGLRVTLLSGDWISLDLPTMSKRAFPFATTFSLGGATEVSIWSICFPIDSVKSYWSSIPYGLPLANQECYVLDERGGICAPDVTGELYISGTGLAIEYHENIKATQKAFVYNQILGKHLYKTGDAAKLSSRGYFEFMGRLDSKIKISGRFIDSRDVEAVINSIYPVKQCVVLSWGNNIKSKVLAAFIVLKSGHKITTNVNNEESRKFLAILKEQLVEKLPRYMIPKKFSILKTLPLNNNGKINRSFLENYQGEFFPLTHGVIKAHTKLEKMLVKIWDEYINNDECKNEIGVDDNFFELGGDSLMAMRVLNDIVKKIGIKLTLQDFLLNQTIKQLAHIISTQINEHSDFTKISIKDQLLRGTTTDILNQEVYLDSSISGDSLGVCSETKRIFLTGATGYLGSRLLYDLLEQTSAEIFCLVRSTAKESGLQRIIKQISKLKSLTTEKLARIVPIQGDLSQALLGQTSKDFDLLAQTIDEIVHCGAKVNFLMPRTSLKSVNVAGTIELLKLATRFKLKQINYISTVSVFPTMGKNVQHTFTENDNLDQPLPIIGGYPQSKWIAEKTMLLARQRGVPINIFRPGVIFGDFRIGDLPNDVLLIEFLKICIYLRAIPKLDMFIDVTPVDYVAKAIVHISQREKNENFHLTNPNPIHISDFINLLIDSNIEVKQVSLIEWSLLLSKISNNYYLSVSMKTLLSIFENIDSSDNLIFGKNLQSFSCENTLNALHRSSIKCPKIDGDFINNFRNSLLNH